MSREYADTLMIAPARYVDQFPCRECQNDLKRKGEVSDTDPVRYPKRTSFRAWALLTTLGAAVVPFRIRSSRRKIAQ